MKPKYKKLTAKQGKTYCDELWATIVKLKGHNRCAVCQSTKQPNAHHLISRSVGVYRYCIDNGLVLCPLHHCFSNELSAHRSPWHLEQWLAINKPLQYDLHVKWRNDIYTDKRDYHEEYNRLENIYYKLTGKHYKLHRIDGWIISKHIDIIKELSEADFSAVAIAGSLELNSNKLKKFMKENKISNK